MWDWLKNTAGGIKSFVGNIFTPRSQPPTNVVSPIPDVYSRFTAPSGTQALPYPSAQLPPTASLPDRTPSGGEGGGGGAGGGGFDFSGAGTGMVDSGSFVDSIVSSIVDPVSRALDKWRARLEEFDKNNPFAFDEAQARASAEERLNPYYDATLNEFMTGIRRSSTRSLEDMTRTVGELNADATKLSERERLATQEAIRSSEEGFAGSGLFFSGKRARETGLKEVGGLQTQEDIQTSLGRNLVSTGRTNLRTQEDLALQEARQKRLLEAERTTSLETDIAQRKRETEYQRGLERLQFAGDIPGLSATQRMTLENEFLRGLS